MTIIIDECINVIFLNAIFYLRQEASKVPAMLKEMLERQHSIFPNLLGMVPRHALLWSNVASVPCSPPSLGASLWTGCGCLWPLGGRIRGKDWFIHIAPDTIIHHLHIKTPPLERTKFSIRPPVCVAKASLDLSYGYGVGGVGKHGVLVLVATVAVISAVRPVLMVGEIVKVTLTTVTGNHLIWNLVGVLIQTKWHNFTTLSL